MTVIVTDKENIKSIISEIIREVISEELPKLIREAMQKEYLTPKELKELTGWSQRKMFYLRQTEQIPFIQHGRSVLYPYNGIIEFLKKHHIKPRDR
jgi:hypothetical protein